MIRDAVRYPFRTRDPIKTFLIGGFLLATGTILSLVFVLGYLVRVLAPDTATESAPRFERWWTLASDGVRVLILWIVYVSIPLLGLVFWIELYSTRLATEGLVSTFDQQLQNVIIHGLGINIGSPIALRPVVQTVYDLAAIGGVFGNVVPLLSTLNADAVVLSVGIIYGVTLLVSVYLFPIAFANFAVNRTLRSAFEFSSITKVALTRRYSIGWCVAIGFLLLGAVGPILWNEWRLLTAGADWGLLHIGFIPLVAHPTPTGIQSAMFLVVASFVNFYFLIVGYALLSSVLTPLIGTAQTQSTTAADSEEPS
ncbi:DUF4013 domain-containing protein [Halalkalicoccus tibetensis]|uniref:DUF4013 domain-containing protein n=1 Tax=Halalkalicoccus tibetensis TaxID=175632 RepID=A0ABD5V998_9EURY